MSKKRTLATKWRRATRWGHPVCNTVTASRVSAAWPQGKGDTQLTSMNGCIELGINANIVTRRQRGTSLHCRATYLSFAQKSHDAQHIY